MRFAKRLDLARQAIALARTQLENADLRAQLEHRRGPHTPESGDTQSGGSATPAAGGSPTAVPGVSITEILQRLETLEKSMATGRSELKTQGKTEPDVARAQAQALARMRIYFLPQETLEPLARSALANMEDWEVPASVLPELKASLDSISKDGKAPDGTAPDLPRLRGIVNQISSEADYWDRSSDWYDAQVNLWSVVLPLVILFALAICGLTLFWPFPYHVLVAFLSAGLLGTASSILLKLPPMSSVGTTNSWRRQLLGRIIAGLTATAVGFGLLGANLINLQIGSRSASGLVSACLESPRIQQAGLLHPDAGVLEPVANSRTQGETLRAEVDSRDARTAAGDPAKANPESRTNAVRAVGGPPPPSGARAALRTERGASSDPECCVVSSNAPEPTRSRSLNAGDLPKDGAKPNAPQQTSPEEECTPEALMLLFSVGVLLGFSERGLATFGDSVFGTKK
jgi:hypothetical protein